MTSKHRITSSAIVALAVALSATPALADQFDITANGSYVPAGSPALTQTAAASTPTIVRINTPAGGFDWADAGIGAAGGFALSMIGIGSALVVSQRRTRRSKTAITR
jgi:hypothetical protein